MVVKKEFGLIGYPLSHSFSRRFFKEKFNREGLHACNYINHPLMNIRELPDLIATHPKLVGLNVTIPYKETVIPYLDEMDILAEEIGAVNTITIDRRMDKPRLKGFNTDVIGFTRALNLEVGSGYRKALILGTGGASKAIFHVIKDICEDVLLVSASRTGPGIISYSELDEKIISEFELIVNTTPLGAWPELEACPPIPYEFLTENHYLFDLVYNPEVTRFLLMGQDRGARIRNGMKMLEIQAEASWDIWMTALQLNDNS